MRQFTHTYLYIYILRMMAEHRFAQQGVTPKRTVILFTQHTSSDPSIWARMANTTEKDFHHLSFFHANGRRYIYIYICVDISIIYLSIDIAIAKTHRVYCPVGLLAQIYRQLISTPWMKNLEITTSYCFQVQILSRWTMVLLPCRPHPPTSGFTMARM
jgi:hypothetical protein